MSLLATVRRVRRRPRHHHGPGADADLHGYLVARLDAHLAELSRMRRELARPRPWRPGGRSRAIAATAVAARDYADDVARALNGHGDDITAETRSPC